MVTGDNEERSDLCKSGSTCENVSSKRYTSIHHDSNAHLHTEPCQIAVLDSEAMTREKLHLIPRSRNERQLFTTNFLSNSLHVLEENRQQSQALVRL